jgi:hypothetical protein
MSVSLNWCPLMRALVDCGAQVNIMSAAYWKKMNNKAPGPIKADDQLSLVNGEPLHVCGVVFVPVRVAGTLLQPKVRFFVVENLPETLSVILGLEFILEHVHAMFWSSFTFSLKVSPGIAYPLLVSTTPIPSVRQVRSEVKERELSQSQQPLAQRVSSITVALVRTVVVRPRSSCLVNGSVSGIHALSSESKLKDEPVHLFEPLPPTGEYEELTSTAAVVSPKDDVVPVLLYNRSGKFLRCRAGTVVGHLSLATVVPPPESKMVVHPSRIGQISVSQSSGAADDPDVMLLSPDIALDLSNTIPLAPEQRASLRAMLMRNVGVRQ